jgi:hypothetical protein
LVNYVLYVLLTTYNPQYLVIREVIKAHISFISKDYTIPETIEVVEAILGGEILLFNPLSHHNR